MSGSDTAARLKIEMEALKTSLVLPGVTNYTHYREIVSRYQSLQWALEQLRLSTTEEDMEVG